MTQFCSLHRGRGDCRHVSGLLHLSVVIVRFLRRAATARTRPRDMYTTVFIVGVGKVVRRRNIATMTDCVATSSLRRSPGMRCYRRSYLARFIIATIAVRGRHCAGSVPLPLPPLAHQDIFNGGVARGWLRCRRRSQLNQVIRRRWLEAQAQPAHDVSLGFAARLAWAALTKTSWSPRRICPATRAPGNGVAHTKPVRRVALRCEGAGTRFGTE